MAQHSWGGVKTIFTVPRRAATAAVLLAFAVIFFALYLVFDGGEHHSFNAGASPASTVHITAGKQYEISAPDGVDGLARRGVDTAAIACAYQVGSGGSTSLAITPLGTGTRAIHAVATFVAPVTGDVHIECTPAASGTFVDNADDGPADPAGLFVLMATICAGLAVPLGLSYFYARGQARLARAGDDDQVEAAVQAFGVDGEIVDPYRGDIGEQFR